MDEEILAMRENCEIKKRFGRFQQARQLDNLVTPFLEITSMVMCFLTVFFLPGRRGHESPAESLGLVDWELSVRLSLLCLGLLIIVTAVSVWYIGGKQYRWETNDEALILRWGSEERYYYYSEVWSVTYEKYGIGGLRGWEVTIKTEYREEKWRLVIGTQRIYSDFSETPFYILMQNCGLAPPDGVTLESSAIDDAFRDLR